MRGFLLAAVLLCQEDRAEELARLEKAQRTDKLNRYRQANWKAPENSSATDGAVFAFHRRVWKPGGTAVGTIFDTTLHQQSDGEIEWSVAGIRDDQNLVVETCDYHSPRSVYIPAIPPLPCTVTVKGLRRWYCDVPVSFTGTVEGAARRVGKYTLKVEWPNIVVTADAEIPLSIVPQVLRPWEIQAELKPTATRRGGTKELLVPRKGFSRSISGPRAWCGCAGRATRQERPPVPMTACWKVLVSNYAPQPLEDIDSITLTFHHPVEESFEVTSPPLN